MHLRNAAPGPRAPGQALQVEAQLGKLRVGEPAATVLRARPIEQDRVIALLDPFLAQRRQAGAYIDPHRRIRIRARSVVDEERRVLFLAETCWRVRLRDFAHRHAQVWTRAGHVHLARRRQRLNRGVVDLCGRRKKLGICVHGAPLRNRCSGRRRKNGELPLRIPTAALPASGS